MLYTIFELAICLALFYCAKYLNNHGRPVIQWYDKNDSSIRKPFVIPTFSMEMMMYGSLLSPLIPLSVVYLYNPQLVDSRLFVRSLYGWSLNGLVCYLVKSLVGRLRPNFIVTTTDEIKTGLDIYKAILARNPLYKKLFQLESRKSFYSGHASSGSYSGTFIVLFLHSLTGGKADLILSTVKVLVFIAGLYPGITQGVCFFHHWTDVITGHLAGIILASYAFYCVQ